MSGKDFLRILLAEYGFTKSIKIETYRGECGCIGYTIYATDNEGHEYSSDDCEGLIFDIYQIIDYMKENNIEILCCGSYGNYNLSVKDILSDEGLKKYNDSYINNKTIRL